MKPVGVKEYAMMNLIRPVTPDGTPHHEVPPKPTPHQQHIVGRAEAVTLCPDPSPPPPVRKAALATIQQWIDDQQESHRDEEREQYEISARPKAPATVTVPRRAPVAPHPPPQGQHVSMPVPTDSLVQPPPPFAPDVTFQAFREWRRRWTDYTTMVDLQRLPKAKQLAQLRMCLSMETLQVLEHVLQVPPDATCSVQHVLDVLQNYFKGQRNEAERRRAFTSCRQEEGESFADFYVRLTSLS